MHEVIEPCEWVKDNRIVLQNKDTVEHDGVQVRIESQVRAHSLHHTDGAALAVDVLVVAQTSLVEAEHGVNRDARDRRRRLT